ncbi:MAG: hypothetical protein V4676_04370 [Bacteroidota bacterium]
MKNQNRLFTGLLFSILSISATAQLKLPVTNNDLRINLQKVVADFSNNLNSIKGDVLASNPQTIEYASTLTYTGAEKNIITEFVDKESVFSWQAVLITAEDFETAVKKYKWLTAQLKIMTLKFDDYSFSLSGKYQEADERKKFSTSQYVLTPAALSLPKLKIEASIQFYFPDWKVMLTVFQKEREDTDQPTTSEN